MAAEIMRELSATNANERLTVHAHLGVILCFQFTVAPTRTPASLERVARHVFILNYTLLGLGRGQ
jgi:hypothetical protein